MEKILAKGVEKKLLCIPLFAACVAAAAAAAVANPSPTSGSLRALNDVAPSAEKAPRGNCRTAHRRGRGGGGHAGNPRPGGISGE